MIARSLGIIALFIAAFGLARYASAPASDSLDSAKNPPAKKLSATTPSSAPDQTAPGFDKAMARLNYQEQAMQSGRYAELVVDAGYDQLWFIVEDWVKSDAAGVWEWLENGGRDQLGKKSIDHQVFRFWFKIDPEAAMLALRGTPRKIQEAGGGAILNLLFDEDEMVAANAREQFDELQKLVPATQMYVSGTDHHLAIALALPPSALRDQLLLGATRSSFQNDWRETVAWVETLPPEDAKKIQEDVLQAALWWDDDESKAEVSAKIEWAKTWLSNEDNRDYRSRVGLDLVSALSQDDPHTALAWASENLHSRTLAASVNPIIQKLAKEDAASAAEVVEQLPNSGVRAMAARGLLTQWGETDGAAALAWAKKERAANNQLGLESWRHLGSQLGYHAPEVARQFIVDEAQNVPAGFADHAVGNLVQKDARGTVEWAKEIGGDHGKTIYDSALQSWKYHDENAAEKWLSEQE